jgi:hypothetical protein
MANEVHDHGKYSHQHEHAEIPHQHWLRAICMEPECTMYETHDIHPAKDGPTHGETQRAATTLG